MSNIKFTVSLVSALRLYRVEEIYFIQYLLLWWKQAKKNMQKTH